jgi:carbamoyltransferase
MAVVLGVNGADGVGHDAAAALAVDGRLVAAVEEERLVRVKRAYGLPPLHAIREVLTLAGCALSDVDVVAYPWQPAAMGLSDEEVAARLASWCRTVDPDAVRLPKPCFVEHHAAHAWAGLAFMPPNLRAGAVVIVLDGSGESTSGACYRLACGELKQLWSLPQESSVGIFFEAVTQYLGFRWGDEGKTMGLAAYGTPVLAETHPGVPDERVSVAPPFTSSVSPRWRHAEIRTRIISELAALHGERLSFNERADVALAAQEWLQDRILRYVGELIDDTDALVLSGGVALNCTANGQVAAMCARHDVRLVIPPPASDTGVALGAAVAASTDPCVFAPCADPGLGRPFPSDIIVKKLREYGQVAARSYPEELAEELTSHSTICGWLEGGSEIGPRALGHRSILARPDSARVRDRVNVLKGRESWRPLAPSLTSAEFARSFPNSSPSPHMLVAATYDPLAPGRLEGVVHVDGTARPQVVDERQAAYRAVLLATGAAIGPEAVLCTSFNRAGEPIVYTPEDALRSAKQMGLDLLAGDGWIVRL